MPMDDEDYVFARFKSDEPASANQRATPTIRGRAGATDSAGDDGGPRLLV